jgi:two-component system response regulator NreC
MAAHLQLAPHPAQALRAPAAGRDPAAITVALADDRVLVARGMRRLLERDAAFAVETDFGRGRAGEPRRAAPNVVVLDVQLTSGPAILAVGQLRQRMPGTAVVVVTGEPDPVFARQALGAGASSIVLRDRVEDELPEAIRRASHGEMHVSLPLLAALATMRGDRKGVGGLSHRETEVLRLIALGHTSAEIAGELHLSRRTIDSHRAAIHRKLGLATRAELVQFALSRHLIG